MRREKQREEPSSVAVSLQDFWEGTMPFCALLTAGSHWALLTGVASRANKPLEERAPVLHESSGKITPLQEALQVGDNPPSQAVHTLAATEQGQGVLLPLVSSLDLPHEDSRLQDLGEVLLPSRAERCGQTQPSRAAQPLPLWESWPLSPPLAALPSP